MRIIFNIDGGYNELNFALICLKCFVEDKKKTCSYISKEHGMEAVISKTKNGTTTIKARALTDEECK